MFLPRRREPTVRQLIGCRCPSIGCKVILSRHEGKAKLGVRENVARHACTVKPMEFEKFRRSLAQQTRAVQPSEAIGTRFNPVTPMAHKLVSPLGRPDGSRRLGWERSPRRRCGGQQAVSLRRRNTASCGAIDTQFGITDLHDAGTEFTLVIGVKREQVIS